jgi:hypothetical protein
LGGLSREPPSGPADPADQDLDDEERDDGEVAEGFGERAQQRCGAAAARLHLVRGRGRVMVRELALTLVLAPAPALSLSLALARLHPYPGEQRGKHEARVGEGDGR